MTAKRALYADRDARPTMLPVDLAGIPAELRAENRWVLWRLDWKDNRWSKVPYAPSGRKASSTDAATWTNFGAVERMYNRHNHSGYDGIGFMLGDGWAGIDLDGVRDPETLQTHQAARDLIESHGGYSDISPSGTGYKIIGKGKWNADWHRKEFPAFGGEIEVYDAARYFTIVGHGSRLKMDLETLVADLNIQPLLDELAVLGSTSKKPTETTPCQPTPITEDDNSLLAEARQAKNGAKFARLWAGDTSEYGGDDSRADLALCSMLAFWTGPDAGRIDQLFRQSALMRSKWDEQHGATTYGERTIAFALKDRTEFHKPRAPRVTRLSPSTNGKHRATGSDIADDEPQTATEIILAYLRERYRPVFRAGNSIHTEDGDTIPMNVAVAVPTTALINRLAAAVDAPRYSEAAGGGVKREALPSLFRKWGSTAWGDLLDSLPDEDAANLGADAPAAETFRRLVREAMLSEVVLGDIIGKEGVMQTERRSLIGWCERFAKPGRWASIRSKRCWCKRRELAGGEIELMVAIRHELFAQLKADRRLCEMGAKAFARRAKKYGVGESTTRERPGGHNAIVLAPEIVADLTDTLPEDADSNLRDFEIPNFTPEGGATCRGVQTELNPL